DVEASPELAEVEASPYLDALRHMYTANLRRLQLNTWNQPDVEDIGALTEAEAEFINARSLTPIDVPILRSAFEKRFIEPIF
ncbi:MAG: hypothetical protein JWM16_6146, partial [Verrucomicrobiales bacterium]|nr:hypothetical protein [Verrucomicrobiales bacterium]